MSSSFDGGGMFLVVLFFMSHVYKRPKESERSLLKCPNSIARDCLIVPREWQCVKCSTTIYHGFDHVFYCNYGVGVALSYSFKCSYHYHGDSFVRFGSQDEMINLLPIKEKISSSTTSSIASSTTSSTTSNWCLNILLLGKLGVGKSTFINAFVNYLTFVSLDEALDGDLQSLVYSTFITSTKDGNDMEVSVGVPNSWENCKAAVQGESYT